MIKSVIVDDELKSIIGLKWELSNFSDNINIVGTFTNPHEAISYLKEHTIDCLFLDIDMPEMDGFQLLSHFDRRHFFVVFVTPFDQYAIKAIKENAFDYLLKPVDVDDLSQTVSKIKDFLNNRNTKGNFLKSNQSKIEDQIKITPIKLLNETKKLSISMIRCN